MYIIAWRLNDKLYPEQWDDLPTALDRVNVLIAMGYIATLHVRGI